MKWIVNPRLIILLFIWLAAAALVALGVWKSVVSGARSTSHPFRQNVVLLVIDTLRADHLGCYGYDRPVSPNIDALAKKSTLYPRSFSSAPWTLPSHASLFTGLFPYEHGAHTYLLDKPQHKKRKDGSKRLIPTGTYKLKDKFKTLAEYLSDAGYATGAVVANASFLSKRLNLHQGFDRYRIAHKRAEKLNKIAFRWIDKVKDENFFLFMNYMDTHRPYNTRPRPGLINRSVERDSGKLLDKLVSEVLPNDKDPASVQDLVTRVIDQYDTAIANMDVEIGRMIAFLKRRKIYDDTLLIITSDHGEYFGEHRLVEHSKDVYQEALYVPLIIKGFHQTEGEVRKDVVSSVDIPGLIARHLDPQQRSSGSRIFNRVPGNHPIIAENYYSRAADVANPIWGKRFTRIRAALFRWPFKFILSSDGHHEMYRLDRDAKESQNIVRSGKRRVQKYKRQLSRLVADNWKKTQQSSGTEPAEELSEVEIEQMRQLGYVQ